MEQEQANGVGLQEGFGAPEPTAGGVALSELMGQDTPAQAPAGTQEQPRAPDSRDSELESMRAELVELRAGRAEMAELLIERDADKLAAEKNIPRDVALELARLRRGAPQQAQEEKPTQERPRDENGRFVSQPKADPKADPQVEQRARHLMAQNEAILAMGGPDVMVLYKENAQVRQKVNSGEWDFVAAARAWQGEGGGKARAPQPVRNPNNAHSAGGVKNMSDAAFEELNRRLARGEKVDPGR